MTKEELRILREKYIEKYCKSRGWNPKELKTSQLLEIAKNSEYINPKQAK